MTKIYRVALAAFLLFSFSTFAQTFTVSGNVENSETGEKLIGANVYIVSLNLGAVTNNSGNYSIEKVPTGTYTIKASYLGYESKEMSINVSGNMTMNFQLLPSAISLQNVVVEVNRGKERETPITFTELSREELQNEYTTQDVPDLLKTVPGVFTSSNGLGESEIYVRGFDAEHIQILINGVPVNDPESQVVYWSNWTGLSGNASSIQIQRGVGASLVGSGAFGGSVNIQTSLFSSTPKLRLRGSTGYFLTQGLESGLLEGKIADGTGGFETYYPANQNFSIEYTSGQLYNGKLNVYLSYERKAGDSYVNGTNYNGHSYYIGLQSLLGDHVLTLNHYGAPQTHNQARTIQDPMLFSTLGREYNRNNTPYQENYYFKPVFELHHNWSIAPEQNLNTTAFFTTGSGGGKYLRNDFFDVTNGEISRQDVSVGNDRTDFGRHARYVHEKTGVLLTGLNFDSNSGTYTYTYEGATDTVTRATNLINGDFSHSWRNDSQNNHVQFGMNTAYTQRVAPWLSFSLGGEVRHWVGEHRAESFDFSLTDPATGDVTFYDQIEDRYNYDGIVTNLSGFGRLLISPVPELTIMLDGQYANYNSRIEEKPINVFDFATGMFTGDSYFATLNDGTFTDADYERTYNFVQPKFGANYNINEYLNIFGNYSIAKKEPKTGDWYSRSSGPATEQELSEETVTNLEFGVGVNLRNVQINANYYRLDFEDKIESVTLQNGDRETINAGNALHSGFEFAASGVYNQVDGYVSVTVSTNEWQDLNVAEIFGTPAEDVNGKVVPFSPENLYHAGIGYSFTPKFRIGLEASAWENYYVNYDNTARLPNFVELGATVQYGFLLAGAIIDLRLDANNILGKNQYSKGDWTRDFNRSDALAGVFYPYVQQAPLQNFFLTATVTLQ